MILNPSDTGNILIFARPCHRQVASCVQCREKPVRCGCGTRSSRSFKLSRRLRRMSRTLLLMPNKAASNASCRSTRSDRGRLSEPSGTNALAHTTRRRLDEGNGGCSLRVVQQFYRWLYPHSAWASRVRLSDDERQERSIMVAIARRFPDRFKVIENAFAPPEKKEGRSPDSES